VQSIDMHVNVLIVEDDPLVERVLAQCLSTRGFTLHLVRTGKDALKKARQLNPDAIILDLGLPDIPGSDVIRALHQDPGSRHIPILVLTGTSRDHQELELLSGGADDFVTKPFDVEVLAARVQNLVHRARSISAEVKLLQKGGLLLDPRNRIVRWKESDAAALSPKEFDILFLLAKDSPNVVDRNSIATRVWGQPVDEIHPRAIDVHIRWIRMKLAENASIKIEAVSRKGYRLTFC
jgi:DNA-binding response OmpR family regulator